MNFSPTSTGSPLPASVIDEFPASKVHLHPIGNWVWSKGEIHPFHAERGGGGLEGGRLKNSTYQLFWAQNPLRHPELSIPSTAFLLRTQLFLNSQPANIHLKNRYFEEQIHWVPLHLLLNSRSPLLRTTSGKSCILDPIPGILMEDCYTILLPVIVSNPRGQTSKSLFLFFIAGISFTS